MAEPGDPPVSEDPPVNAAVTAGADGDPPADQASTDVPADRPAESSADATAADLPSDWDDGVGFTSPAAMQGRPRETLTISDPPAGALSAPMDAAAGDKAETAEGPDLKSPGKAVASEKLPAWAIETPAAARSPSEKSRKTFGRATEPEPVQGAMWAYTIYAMILFAVPTLGVSAIIGLLAVTGHPAPKQAVARSHYIYQQRTLWSVVAATVLGVILIPIGIGVFVLFAATLWILVRGAAGVLKLKASLPIAEPYRWFV